MSDAPTVPIGSLRAHAPSVPTEPVTLLPCPFCDGQATAADLGGTMTGVRCGGCGATGTEFSRARWRDPKEAERQAIAAWNARPMIAATQQATGEGADIAEIIPKTDDLHRHAVEIYGTARNLGPDNLASFARNCIEQFVEALSTQQAVSPPEGVRLNKERIAAIVEERMMDVWNDIASDTGCHPDDIRQLGRKRLMFVGGHWSRITGEFVALDIMEALAAPDAIGEEKGAGS